MWRMCVGHNVRYKEEQGKLAMGVLIEIERVSY